LKVIFVIIFLLEMIEFTLRDLSDNTLDLLYKEHLFKYMDKSNYNKIKQMLHFEEPQRLFVVYDEDGKKKKFEIFNLEGIWHTEAVFIVEPRGKYYYY